MNIVTVDRSTAVKLVPSRTERPEVVRRLIALPGSKRMAKAELETTPLHLTRGRKKIEIAETPEPSRWDAMRVFFVLSRYLIMLWLRRAAGRKCPSRSGRELREIFQSFGGLWIKVGQLMSLRRDVLSAPFCDELARLQHRAVGFSPDAAVRCVEDELGAPIDKLFAAFDPHPIAAASLSQVHIARMRYSNAYVAVKILRPGIEKRLKRDLWILRRIANFLSFFSSRVRRLKLGDAAAELEEIFREEIDFRYEASNMKELRRIVRSHGVIVPKAYEKYCTKRVLVMEWISGALMSDYIQARHDDPIAADAWLKENNIKPKKVAKRLLISFMRQLFEENLFHADLHPGNIILLRGNKVALIDLGALGTLDQEFLTIYRSIWRAIADKNFSKAADYQLRLCRDLPGNHLEDLRAELARWARLWSMRNRVRSLPYRERSVNSGSAEVSRILSNYGVQQSWEFLKIGRTIATLDASIEYLHEGLDYVRVLQSYFEKSVTKSIRKAINPSSAFSAMSRVVSTANEYNVMLGPTLRSSAFSLEGTISRFSRIGVVVTRLSIVSIVMITFVLVYEFLDQHYEAAWDIKFMDKLTAGIPDISYPWWAVIMAACLLILYAMRHILRELTTVDPRSGRS